MVPAELRAALASLDEAALTCLARIADRVLAAPPGFDPGPWLNRRRAGQGQEFLDFAPHLPGSDARRIDWRASARGRALLERRHQDASASRFTVCLDLSPSMGPEASPKRLLSVQLAAAVSYLLLHREHEVGLVGFSDRINSRCAAARGRAQYPRLLACLSEAMPAARASRLEVCLGALSRRQSVVVVSDFLRADAMCDGLALMSRRGGHLHALQVLAGDEFQVTGPPGTVVEDAESRARLALEDPEQASRGAHGALVRQQQRLRSFCQGHGMALSVCNAGDRWQELLLNHLLRARCFDA